MKQRRETNLTKWTVGLALVGASVCASACEGDDGLELGGASSASTVKLMPACAYADAGLPVLTTPLVLTARQLNIWPPNHKFHSIDVADCVTVTGACDPGLTAEFIWASSDEPVDSRGDGHHAPDILFDGCDHVQVRSERQGPKDGRVYKLGVRTIDSAGRVAEAACTIVVDHDQRGVLGADSGESYRVVPTDPGTGFACDGHPDLPPLPPIVPPPVVVPDAGPSPLDF
jgi:hypothetical protein